VSGPVRGTGARPTPAARRRGAVLTRGMLGRLVWNPPARAWIGLVAFALIGIVAGQLWVVKLGAGIGRALEHVTTLERENAALAVEVSTLSSGERVERFAAARGMVPGSESAVSFLRLRGGLDARQAVVALAHSSQPPTTSTEAAATEASPGG